MAPYLDLRMQLHNGPHHIHSWGSNSPLRLALQCTGTGNFVRIIMNSRYKITCVISDLDHLLLTNHIASFHCSMVFYSRAASIAYAGAAIVFVTDTGTLSSSERSFQCLLRCSYCTRAASIQERRLIDHIGML